MSIRQISTELYPIQEESFRQIKLKEYYQYELESSNAIIERFGSTKKASEHFARLIATKYGPCSVVDRDTPLIISATPIDYEDTLFMENDQVIQLILKEKRTKLDFSMNSDFKTFQALFYKNMQVSLQALGYE